MKQSLVNDDWLAQTEPDPYLPGQDVVAWRPANDGRIVLETFHRSNGTFGFRYQVWVEWRDAGDEVQGRSWHEIRSDFNVVTDALQQAQVAAENHAASKGVTLGPTWSPIV